MLSPHTSAAIAQTVFYAPIVPLCFYIVIRNWKYPPKMAWIPFMTFSLSKVPEYLLVWRSVAGLLSAGGNIQLTRG